MTRDRARSWDSVGEAVDGRGEVRLPEEIGQCVSAASCQPIVNNLAYATVIVQGDIASGNRLYAHKWTRQPLFPSRTSAESSIVMRECALTGSLLDSLISQLQHHALSSKNAQLPMTMDDPLPRLSRWSAKDKKLNRFDNCSESDRALVGPHSRGHIRVDCHFMFRQSEWGTLTKAKHPGGIVYIDLDFHQPPDCRLKSATIRLTLDDGDPALANFAGGKKTPGASSGSIHILRHGPEPFCGPPSRAYKTTRHSAIPRFDVGGFAGAGGLGRESERHTEEVSRWDFASHLTCSDHAEAKPSQRTSWAANQLIWTLTESELAGRAVRNSIVHTGFAFAHGGQPFFMKLEVSGRLESRLSNAYNNFRQAFGSSSRSDSFATTLVEFGDVTRFTRSLDRRADQLARISEPFSIAWSRRHLGMPVMAFPPLILCVSEGKEQVVDSVRGSQHQADHLARGFGERRAVCA